MTLDSIIFIILDLSQRLMVPLETQGNKKPVTTSNLFTNQSTGASTSTSQVSPSVVHIMNEEKVSKKLQSIFEKDHYGAA